MANTLSKQAMNSIALFMGNPASTIERALKMQKASVVDELKQHYGATSIQDLAMKISRGY